MSSSKFSDAFEREAVAQITEGPCGVPPDTFPQKGYAIHSSRRGAASRHRNRPRLGSFGA